MPVWLAPPQGGHTRCPSVALLLTRACRDHFYQGNFVGAALLGQASMEMPGSPLANSAKALYRGASAIGTSATPSVWSGIGARSRWASPITHLVTAPCVSAA